MQITPLIQATLASLLISSVALLAVYVVIFLHRKLKHLTATLVSLAAGILIGDVFLHILPELFEQVGYTTEAAIFILIGITTSLIIEAAVHCYNHRHVEEHQEKETLDTNPALPYLSLVSDGLHNVLDGISIGASFIISPALGLITTTAILLHEIPQELADVGVLLKAGWSKRKIIISNISISFTALIGVFAAFILSSIIPGITYALLAFTCGQLTYVALADLLPEIHTHHHGKLYILQISTFILGILSMLALTLIG